MEIQNLKRRNSEYELFKSQRKVSERVYLCSRLEMKEHLHQECYARSCREIDELRIRCNGEGNYWRKTKMGRINFLRSMIRNHEQWVCSSTILTYWAAMTYLRSSSISYYTKFEKAEPRSWNTAKYTREMSFPGNVFDFQHARRDLDELHNDSRKLAISLAFLRREGIENSGSEKNIAINTLTLLFSKSEERTSRRQISLMSITNDALGIWTCTQVVWQFRVISTRICICNSLTRRNSELDREFPSRSLRKSSKKKERAKHSYTERKTEECVQRKTIGLCSRRDACSLLHTRATGDTVRRTWNEVEIRKKFSSRSKHPLRYRKWKTQTDGKSLNSVKANPTTKAENSLSTVGKMKNIVAWLSTSSRVSWLQVWKQMHSLLSLLMSTSWWWEEQPQREVEKKVLRDKLLSWKKKIQGCVSQNSAPYEFYSTES